MDLSEENIREYSRRLLISRIRLLCNNGFYGMLLMHMDFGLDSDCRTAYTDGKGIFFNPEFMDELSDPELDFVLMHEILHVALRHCSRGEGLNQLAYNISCDIVVNSNILLSNNMDKRTITLGDYGEAMHTAPNKREGHEFTAEEVYEMFPKSEVNMMELAVRSSAGSDVSMWGDKKFFDDHSRWPGDLEDNEENEKWQRRIIQAAETIELRERALGRGLLPAFAQRLLRELREPQIDWRTILNEFIQEEVVDYSFLPPDRRFSDGDFFLPDFNDTENVVKDILFMVDTSGSMSDDMITDAFSEIKGAIGQFNGALKGWLGFFDAAIVEPQAFETLDEFRVIHPVGGGGTDFKIIFDYVADNLHEPPASIIILTDGYAPWPDESDAMGIPVLWIINNEDQDPPWGKVARIISE